MGQLVQMIVQLPVEHRLQCYSGALVQELAALDQQRVDARRSLPVRC
jgi:hypothetical protein